MTFSHLRDRELQSNGAVAVTRVAPWMFAPGRWSRRWLGSDPFRVPTLACTTAVVMQDVAAGPEWQPRRLAVWRQAAAPHDLARRVATSPERREELHSRRPRRPPPPAPTVPRR